MAALFQRYRIKNLKAKYIPGCSTTTVGTLCFGFVDDDNPSSTVLTGDQILNLRLGCETSPWKNRTLSYRPIDSSKWYYTLGGNDRFVTQATFVAATGIALTPSTTLGDFDLEGDIEFEGATLVSV
jgi:hypothetical protein